MIEYALFALEFFLLGICLTDVALCFVKWSAEKMDEDPQNSWSYYFAGWGMYGALFGSFMFLSRALTGTATFMDVFGDIICLPPQFMFMGLFMAPFAIMCSGARPVSEAIFMAFLPTRKA